MVQKIVRPLCLVASVRVPGKFISLGSIDVCYYERAPNVSLSGLVKNSGRERPGTAQNSAFHFIQFWPGIRSRSWSQSRRSRHISAGAGVVRTFCSDPEPELEPSKKKSFGSDSEGEEKS